MISSSHLLFAMYFLFAIGSLLTRSTYIAFEEIAPFHKG